MIDFTKIPKYLKISLSLFMISNLFSIYVLIFDMSENINISFKIATLILIFLTFILYYKLFQGKNWVRIMFLIGALLGIQSLFLKTTIQSSLFSEISTFIFILGTILLFTNQTTLWFKNFQKSVEFNTTASLFLRLFAFVIDILFLVIIMSFLSLYMFDWLSSLNILITKTLGFLITGVYFVGMETLTSGTIGKRVMWIRLSTFNLQRPSFTNILLRYIIFAFPFFFVNIAINPYIVFGLDSIFMISIFLTGYLFFVSGSNAQTHYDQITGIYVIDDNLTTNISPEPLWSVNYKVMGVVVFLILWANYPSTSQNLTSKLIDEIAKDSTIKIVTLKKGSYPIKPSGKHIQYVAIYLLVDNISKNQEQFLGNIAKKVINNYLSLPEELYIITMHGYDLGIIKNYDQTRDARTILEWKDRLLLENSFAKKLVF